MLELADLQWMRSYSIIYLSFSSAATIFLNGFALFVIYKDPLKCFRDPLKEHFIITFMTNLVLGLVGELLIAFWHIKATFDAHVPWVFANGLGLMVLNIAIAQLLPFYVMDLYQPWVAKRLSILFWVSFGIDLATVTLAFSNLEFIHALGIMIFIPYWYVNLIILVIILIANWKAFHGRGGQQAATIHDEFFKGTIIITLFLIATALLFLVNTVIDINFIKNGNYTPSPLVGLILSYSMLLKFLLDPLVFIFRVPKYYRRAVRIVCVECGRVGDEDDDALIQELIFVIETDIQL